MRKSASRVRFAVIVALLVATNLFLHARKQLERIPASDKLATFPKEVGGWAGQDRPIAQDVLDILGPGDFLSRAYFRDPQTPYIDLFIAYFSTQKQGDTIHSPRNCLPGAGWVFMESGKTQLAAPGGKPFFVNRFIIANGLDRQLVLYWYQAHGRAVTSEYSAKIYLVADAIRLNRTDGALVRVITPILRSESLETAEQRAVSFTQGMLLQLNRYIPD